MSACACVCVCACMRAFVSASVTRECLHAGACAFEILTNIQALLCRPTCLPKLKSFCLFVDRLSTKRRIRILVQACP